MTDRILWAYPFPLEDGTVAKLHLPPDLGRRDVERLKRFVDALVDEPAVAASVTPEEDR